jgi:flagellar export protein FliJ
MKKFKFKLEVVLSERKKVEDLRRKEWTMAMRFLQALMDDLAELERQLAEAIERGDQLATIGQAPAGPGALAHPATGMFQVVDGFIAGQKMRIAWKAQEIERAAKFTERRRVDYVAARQKREALEKLRARKLAEYRAESKKQELRKLDDLYIMNGAARRRIEAEGEEPDPSTEESA